MKFLILVSLTFTSLSIFGQTGVWTWIKGSNEFNTPPIFGEMGIASPDVTPSGCYESVAWTGLDGTFWMFGGHGAIAAQNDLWRFDLETNNWTWVKGSGESNHPGHYGTQGVASPENLPPARWLGAFNWVDNDGNLWLYGGANHTDGGNGFNDLWKYDISTNMWTWINGSSTPFQIPQHGTQGVSSPSNQPGWRAETAASWVDDSNNLWLFGGLSSDNLVYNDLWKYNISVNEWVWMKGSSEPESPGYYGTQGISSSLNEPPARIVFASWKDSVGNFWIFGGSISIGSNDLLSDLWKYDPNINEWTWMKGPSTLDDPGNFGVKCFPSLNNNPSARMENRANWIDNDELYMFGGVHSPPTGLKRKLNDLWVYSIENNTWTWISGDSEGNTEGFFGELGVPSTENKPLGRMGAVAWYDNAGAAYVFGGTLYNPASPLSSPRMNDLWKFEVDKDCVSGVVGIEDVNGTLSYVVYPNPVDQFLNIDFGSEINNQLSLQIYNAKGQLVKAEFIPPGASHWQLSTTHFASGLFKLLISNSQGLHETRNFLIIR